MVSKKIQQEIVQIPQKSQRVHQYLPVFNPSSSGSWWTKAIQLGTDEFLQRRPYTAKPLAVQNVNNKIDVQSKMFSDVTLTHRLDNRISKGKDLLYLLEIIKFRVLVTYSKHSNYTTWPYFNYTIIPHMLYNFICSQPLLRLVKYCKLLNIGMRSDYTAILTTIKITSIKFKLTEKIAAQT